MAGPRIFVQGPSVNPSIGTPAQFLTGIQRTIGNRKADKRAKEQLEQQKIFQNKGLQQRQDQLDFNLAAPERAEQLRVDALARDVDRTQTIENYAKGAQFAGGDRFTGLEDQLMKDQRYASLDDAGKLAARNEYILNNPTALTDPKTFANTLRSGLTASGKFTGAEVDAAVAAQVAQRYPTADKDLIKSQLLSPKDLIPTGSNTNNFRIGADGTVKSTSGSFANESDSTDPVATGEIIDRLQDTFKFPDSESISDSIFGDFGQHDATKQSVSQAMGFLAANGVVSPTAQENALRLAFTSQADATVKDDFNWNTEKGRTKLLEEATKIQNAERAKFNKKTGGDLSQSGQAGAGRIFTPSDAVNAAALHNERLLSRTVPKNLSDTQVLESFLNRLGPAPGAVAPDTTRQGVVSPGDGAQVAPPPAAVLPPAQTNTLPPEALGLQNLTDVTGGDTLPAPTVGPVVQQQVGGQAPEEVVMQQLRAALENTPAGMLASSNANAANEVGKLLSNMAPAAGNNILTPPKRKPAAQAEKDLSRVADVQAELDDLPPPGQRTLLQKAYASDLEQELKELKRK